MDNSAHKQNECKLVTNKMQAIISRFTAQIPKVYICLKSGKILNEDLSLKRDYITCVFEINGNSFIEKAIPSVSLCTKLA